MYCMSVEYLREEGSRFDHDYYRDTHLPLCRRLLDGRGLVGTVLRLDAGKAPGRHDLFWASVDIVFESEEQLKAALAEVGGEINADVPNYTDIRPRVSFAEISVALD
ncbi:EthD family reductase [Parahaliea mediterranea]|uniref:EthD family reductase n=1 Tax=Parahaliea mediterranea TaxID=651086 RepID=A0A939IMC1_9GAMM|nr:EthD family reductase [Parahaliea mediterranea]MBN7797355.1 EthD family reductase [Parahaliea mediterranea]